MWGRKHRGDTDARSTQEIVEITKPWPVRACCCCAPPVVEVVLPAAAHRDHTVDLFLCGHHYRAALDKLDLAQARAHVRGDRVVDPQVTFARALRRGDSGRASEAQDLR